MVVVHHELDFGFGVTWSWRYSLVCRQVMQWECGGQVITNELLNLSRTIFPFG